MLFFLTATAWGSELQQRDTTAAPTTTAGGFNLASLSSALYVFSFYLIESAVGIQLTVSVPVLAS